MKCPYCGAELGESDVCEYCGSHITAAQKREMDLLNRPGCPNCGSKNITFSREQKSVLRTSSGTAYINATVGLCRDCGYTWETDVDENEYLPDDEPAKAAPAGAATESESAPVQKKTKHVWLWVLGWIYIFPLPLTIILVRNKKMNTIFKGILIAMAWLFYIGVLSAY